MQNLAFWKSWKSKPEECKVISIMYIVGSVLVIGYFLLLFAINHSTDNSCINTATAKSPLGCYNFWIMTHFVFYFILGFFFPNQMVLVLGLGIVWEVIEQILGCLSPPINMIKPSGKQAVQWWKGSVIDIFVNILGFFAGVYVRKYIIKYKNKVSVQ